MSGPYDAAGNPIHPGVTGKPYSDADRGGPKPAHQPNEPHTDDVPLKDQDNTGTGTYPPEQQGIVNRAQPAGISAQTQYGEPTTQNPQGVSGVPNPVTSPLPPEEEEEEEEA